MKMGDMRCEITRLTIVLLGIFLHGLLVSAQLQLKEASAPQHVEGKGILFTFKALDAYKVYLAGDFNNWANHEWGKVTDPEFLMEKGKKGVWYKIIPLARQEYKYQFVMEAKEGQFAWKPDPHVSEKDKEGNSILDARKILPKGVSYGPLRKKAREEDKEVSGEEGPDDITEARAPQAVKGGVLFTFKAPDAVNVYVAGDFNEWANNQDGEITEDKFGMERGKTGVWHKVVSLKPGKYKYKFVVKDKNGKFNWQADPLGKEKDDWDNTLLDTRKLKEVKEGEVQEEKIGASAPKVVDGGILFSFEAPRASKVYLAGDFNNWANNDEGKITDKEFLMEKGEDGVWRKTVKLPPGAYAYKFAVDGDWQADPNVTEKDGDGNSILDTEERLEGEVIFEDEKKKTPLGNFVSDKLVFNGDIRSFLPVEREDGTNTWRFTKPEIDARLETFVDFSRFVNLWAEIGVNTGTGGAGDINIRFNRSTLKLGRGSFQLTGFYNMWTLDWKDPFHLIGKVGEFKEDFGEGQQGFQISMPLLFFDELKFLYADDNFAFTDTRAARIAKKIGPVKLGLTFKDRDFWNLLVDVPDPDGSPQLFDTHQREYLIASDFRVKIKKRYDFFGAFGYGQELLIADKTKSNQGVPDSSKVRATNKPWELQQIIRFVIGARVNPWGGLTNELSYEREIHDFSYILLNWKIRFNRLHLRNSLRRGRFKVTLSFTDYFLSIKEGSLLLSLPGVGLTLFQGIPISWASLSRYSWYNRFEHYQYLLIGYKNALFTEANIQYQAVNTEKAKLSLGLSTKMAQTYPHKEPKVIENILKFNFIYKKFQLVFDRRVITYNDNLFNLHKTFFDSYMEFGYRVNKWIRFFISYGFDPEDRYDLYKSRYTFLNDEGVNLDTAFFSFEKLGQSIFRGESSLSKGRQFNIRSEIKF